MIKYLSIALLVLLTALLWRKMYQKRGRRLITETVIVIALIAVLALALTGRLHWVGAASVYLLALLRQLLPLLLRLFQGYLIRRRYPAKDLSAMNPAQARAVLGVAENAGREEIIAAHKRLLQRLHPDKGGSVRLTAIVNQARDVLLEQS